MSDTSVSSSKKNLNVDLISYYHLRTPDSIDPARKGELSLIPFPTRELFEEQLDSFDLVIFQNFTYRGFRMRRYLPRIRDYVKAGGGFVMVGDLSFTSGGICRYAHRRHSTGRLTHRQVEI